MRALVIAVVLVLPHGALAQEPVGGIIFPGFLDLKLEPGDRIIPENSENLVFVETPGPHDSRVNQQLERYRSLLQSEGWKPVPKVRGSVLRLDAGNDSRCISVQGSIAVQTDKSTEPTRWGVTFHRLNCSELSVIP
jgi:hypothetical protein